MNTATPSFFIHYFNAVKLNAFLRNNLKEHLFDCLIECTKYWVKNTQHHCNKLTFGYMSKADDVARDDEVLSPNWYYQEVRMTEPWNELPYFEYTALALALHHIESIKSSIVEARSTQLRLSACMQLQVQREQFSWEHASVPVLLPCFNLEVEDDLVSLSEEQQRAYFEVVLKLSTHYATDPLTNFVWLEKIHPELIQKAQSLKRLYEFDKSLMIEV